MSSTVLYSLGTAPTPKIKRDNVFVSSFARTALEMPTEIVSQPLISDSNRRRFAFVRQKIRAPIILGFAPGEFTPAGFF